MTQSKEKYDLTQIKEKYDLTQIKEKYDLTPRFVPNGDRHLIFPMLEFLEERQLYTDEQIKIELHHTDVAPKERVERRAQVVARLKSPERRADKQ